LVAALAAAAAERPNIVFILTDDQRFDAIGAINPYFTTPHLDAMLREGLHFPNAFVTTSLCSPSRASILTGQWAHKHGVLDNITPLPPALPTFPRRLQEAGYATGFFGKWHMGGDSDAPQPGFDAWLSFRGQGVYFDPVLNVDGRQEKVTGYITDIITEQALRFIERHKSGPFMLYVSHKAVHDNFAPPERYKHTYDNRLYPCPATYDDSEENYAGKPAWVRAQRDSWHGVDDMYNGRLEFDAFTQRYAETLRAVDDSVGAIIETLKKHNLWENTILVFTSDNGFQFGEHGLIDKRTMYEASIRVPLIVHAPAIPPGKREQMVLNTDFCPTFLEAAGLPVPDSVQGESFFPLLGQPDRPGRQAFLYTYFWERSFPQTPTVLGVRTPTHKLMQYHGINDRYEMYDLIADPGERHNLLGAFFTPGRPGHVEARMNAPDVPQEIRERFRDLKARLNAELKRLDCAPEPNWRTAP
jgi:N-acetylglucosamine-6-sulfatase